MKPETQFRNSISGNAVNGCYVMAIEAGGSHPGFPDTVIHEPLTNNIAFVELKAPDKKDQKRGCIGMRHEQVVWHSKFFRRGGTSNFILVKFDLSFMLWEGKYAEELEEKNYKEVHFLRWYKNLSVLKDELHLSIFPGGQNPSI